MDKKTKIKGKPELKRDNNTRAVINTSKSEYDRAIEARNKRLSIHKRMEILEDNVDKILSLLSHKE